MVTDYAVRDQIDLEELFPAFERAGEQALHDPQRDGEREQGEGGDNLAAKRRMVASNHRQRQFRNRDEQERGDDRQAQRQAETAPEDAAPATAAGEDECAAICWVAACPTPKSKKLK